MPALARDGRAPVTTHPDPSPAHGVLVFQPHHYQHMLVRIDTGRYEAALACDFDCLGTIAELDAAEVRFRATVQTVSGNKNETGPESGVDTPAPPLDPVALKGALVQLAQHAAASGLLTANRAVAGCYHRTRIRRAKDAVEHARELSGAMRDRLYRRGLLRYGH